MQHFLYIYFFIDYVQHILCLWYMVYLLGEQCCCHWIWYLSCLMCLQHASVRMISADRLEWGNLHIYIYIYHKPLICKISALVTSSQHYIFINTNKIKEIVFITKWVEWWGSSFIAENYTEEKKIRVVIVSLSTGVPKWVHRLTLLWLSPFQKCP